MLERVDVDALVGQVRNLDELLDRIDVNRLLNRVDLTRLLDRVEVVNRLLDHVDVDRLLDRVDVNKLLERVDVQAVAKRANVGNLVAQSTSQVAGSTLDVARRQAVGVDTLIMGFADRLLGRIRQSSRSDLPRSFRKRPRLDPCSTLIGSESAATTQGP